MAASNTHNIVILGGSYSGMGAAHGLLKALPAMRKYAGKDFKVIIVSNSTHFWFSVGAPRAMLKPYPKDLMDSFIPISKGFSKYPSSDFEFVFGEITSIDTNAKDVLYKAKNENDEIAGATSNLHYDSLIIASGSRGPSPLFSLHGSHVATLEAYKDMHVKVPAAKSIFVMGGGSAGVETAGELGYLYGKNTKEPKDVTIYSGADRLLAGLQPHIGAKAEEILNGMGVKVVHKVRLESENVLPSGQTEVKFDNGETKNLDLLIVATGRQPYAPFLPSSISTDKRGRIESDAFLRVKDQESIYSTGDVSSVSPGGLIFVMFATPILVGNVVADLTGKGKAKEYKPMTEKDMQIVPLGPETGTGAIFGWRLPGFAVKMMKSKDMMWSKAMQNVMGS